MKGFACSWRTRYPLLCLTAVLGTIGGVLLFFALAGGAAGVYSGSSLDELVQEKQECLLKTYSSQIFENAIVNDQKEDLDMWEDSNMEYAVLETSYDINNINDVLDGTYKGDMEWKYLYKSPTISEDKIRREDFTCVDKYAAMYDGEEYSYYYTETWEDPGLFSCLFNKGSTIETWYEEEDEEFGVDRVTIWIVSRVKDSLDESAKGLFAPVKNWMGFLYRNRYIGPGMGIFLVIAAAVIFGICVRGRYLESRAGAEKSPDPSCILLWHRLPMVFVLAVFGIAIALTVWAGGEMLLLLWNGPLSMGYLGLAGAVVMGFLLLWLLMAVCLEVSCRAGLGNLGHTILCCRLWHWFGRLFRSARENIPCFVKALAILAWISLLELIVFAIGDIEGALFAWFLFKLVEIPLMIKLFLDLAQLQRKSREMAQGDMDSQIDTSRMYWEVKKHGDNLNRINDGMQIAMGERMKSEHLRTELITNVSHDIKTPLTSIINYVDLLKKEDIAGERAKEYLEVLDRQSARLGKLIQDLMEASKASTGNVTVIPELCDVNILLAQVAGEFEERLGEKEIPLVIEKPEQPFYIMADNRHLFRIFDNLMSNICKYGQPGTRAYINLEGREHRVQIIFRNVSRAPLNISNEELMERFVRGDGSRHTEGSGLGLAIARDLTKLMGGSMEVVVDGDLFKCILCFPEIVPPREEDGAET